MVPKIVVLSATNKYSVIIYPLIGGLLLGFTIAFSKIWFLNFIAFIPLLYTIYNSNLTKKSAFIVGWIFGSAFLGIAYFPILQTIPLDWIVVENYKLGVFFVFLYWGLFVFTLSIFSGGFWSLFVFKYQNDHLWYFVFISILWVILEYVRLWWFSLLTIGNGSLLGPHFSVGLTGYILAANNTLLQLASVGGVYLLSFVVILTNTIIFWSWRKRSFPISKRLLWLVFGGILFAVTVSLPVSTWLDNNSEYKSQEILTWLVQTQFKPVPIIDSFENHRRFEFLRDMTSEKSRENSIPDVIVYPEYSRFMGNLIKRSELNVYFDKFFEGAETIVIDSDRVLNTDQTIRSRMFHYSVRNHSLQTFDKFFLVPVGEYLPSIYESMLRILRDDKLLTQLKLERSTPHMNSLVPIKHSTLNIGGLFCSEMLSPSLYSKLTGKGANILVNVSSTARFHESRIYHNQAIAVHQVRAVENNRYLVRSANFSPAFAIDNRGRIVFEGKWGENDILPIVISVIEDKTIYSKIVDVFQDRKIQND